MTKIFKKQTIFRVLCGCLFCLWGFGLWGEALAQQSSNRSTSLPLPRMVSVQAKESNVRAGPGTSYPISWVYRQSNVPVQVIAEYGVWRKIRDWEGAEGWIHNMALSSRRGLLIMRETVMRRLAADTAPAVARLTPGLTGRIETCEAVWCYVSISGYDGWVKRDATWGLDPGETVE